MAAGTREIKVAAATVNFIVDFGGEIETQWEAVVVADGVGQVGRSPGQPREQLSWRFETPHDFSPPSDQNRRKWPRIARE